MGSMIEDLPYPFDEDEEEDKEDITLLGFVIANILGVENYYGTFSSREMVFLVLDSRISSDPNTIRVLNTRQVLVGHLDSSVAAVLAPLLKHKLVSFAEAFVPRSKYSPDRFKIPFKIHLYAKLESVPTVRSSLSRAGLALLPADLGLPKPGLLALWEEAKKKNSKVKNKHKVLVGNDTMDCVFESVYQGLRKGKGVVGKLEPSREAIRSNLFEHQKEGLWWLWDRENSGDLPPFWEEKQPGTFFNSLTNHCTNVRPEPLRGGVFADDMGLGKTLTLLSLIAMDKYGSSDNVDDFRASSGKKRMVKEIYSDEELYERICVRMTTLVVCPPSVLSAWQAQLEEHTSPGSLSVYLYHGDRTNDLEELKKYDIVLTTYGTLAKESTWPSSAAKEMKWWRVILDEAHVIKNKKSKQSLVVCGLNADRRWVVTGTPIQNNSFDLYALIKFLGFDPFSIWSLWLSLIDLSARQKRFFRLKVLFATISIRRTKEERLEGLPKKTIEICYIKLSPEERRVYDIIARNTRYKIKRYIHGCKEDISRYNDPLVIESLLLLRLICADIALYPEKSKRYLTSNSIPVANSPELLKKIDEAWQEDEDFDCPICISSPTNLVITSCSHIFCHDCILRSLHVKSTCPLCRGILTKSNLFSAALFSRTTMSTKTAELLKLLNSTRHQNPATKSVIFSQFTSMLDLLEEPIRKAGFNILRIDGTMSAKKRAQVVKEFGTSGGDSTKVMLASLKASAMGINLTAASIIYIFEPWWNPAIEDQAMDRIHRIGQKQDVKIVRLIARGTIEDEMLKLQAEKKEIAEGTFRRKGSEDRKGKKR